MTKETYTVFAANTAYLVPIGHDYTDCDCDPCTVAHAGVTAVQDCIARIEAGYVVCQHGFTLMTYPSGTHHDVPVEEVGIN